MERTRRATLGLVGSALLGAGCLASGERAPDEDAVVMRFEGTGATETGAMWIRLQVENEGEVPAEATCYVHAVEPGETHTEARYYELDPGEQVAERVVFPDVEYDPFQESRGYVEGNVEVR